MNFQNIENNRFSRLLVLQFCYTDTKGISYWLCKCDCGVEKVINGKHLKSGNTTSCGCYNKEKTREINFQDITNQRFGKLTVIKFSHMNKNAQSYWLCRCDCGTEKIINSNNLKNGQTTSCGCYNRQKLSNYQSGQNNINWRGGTVKQKYPKEWKKSLRESIRNRDDHKCRFPNCEYDDTKEIRKLHVHHIDGNKNNCQEYNLISLCNSHHATVETNNPQEWIDYFYQITGDFD